MSVEKTPSIVIEQRESVAIVRFDRPAQRNSLSTITLQELDSITSSLFDTDDLTAMIFTGAADVFSAGANIRELAQLDSRSAFEFSKFGQTLFQKIADARQATIAAINGFCMGGALDLALACDIRVAASSAVFSHPGAKRGIITGWGGTQRLAQTIGRTRALEFFITARQYSANEALKFGLVSKVSDPVVDCALEVARSAEALTNLS